MNFFSPVETKSRLQTRYLGIFILAFASLSYQVVLTRIFSVILYYHFAFAGISLAMLGLTIGAERIYLRRERFTPERFELEWVRAALGFSISASALVLWFLVAPLFLPGAAFTELVLVLFMLLFTIPFTYSGICITLILTRSEQVGRLYAADLIGAALGCAGIVWLLFRLDPVTIVFGLSALSALAAWRMAKRARAMNAAPAFLVMLLMTLAFAAHGAFYLTGHAHVKLLWAKGAPQRASAFERWNAISRVRVKPPEMLLPFGWGFGATPDYRLDQAYLDIDADAATMITRFNGNLRDFRFLSEDVINMAYHVRPVERAAIIGVGGGRDIMSALYFGAKSAIGIELNPAIFEAITGKFADFDGHFFNYPGVSLVQGEARSWLNEHKPSVDLVQISLIDTWAATAAGGLTMSENRLYTQEAWKEFLSRLSPHGMLSVSRWFVPEAYRGEFYRLLSLASQALEAQGVPQVEVRRHILAFNARHIVTVLVSRSPFSVAEVARARAEAKMHGFTPLLTPDAALDETSAVIASGKADAAFYARLPLDVTPPSDDRPFFFYMTPFSKSFGEMKISTFEVESTMALRILGMLLIGTLLITLAFVVTPLQRASKTLSPGKFLPDLLYFAGIGLGFMLIEISQMQRLIVFLGHPIYGLSVVLFTLLLFGGLGSMTIGVSFAPRNLWLRPASLCLVLASIGLVTPECAHRFADSGTTARILISVALLAPAGFMMGMMFPIGMRISAQNRDLQPWFWGINGAVSVFASILGMVISLEYGISSAYWTGVGAYGLCLSLTIFRKKTLLSDERSSAAA
jgi:spermidine synthase